MVQEALKRLGAVAIVKFVLFSLLFLIGFQFLLIQPFFHPGFFPTHDDIQTIRIFEYYQSLKYSVLPPRWSSGLLFGYGYPLFIFYSPLVYLLGSLFVFLGFNFLLATKMIFILCFFIGVTGIFFLLRFFIKDLFALITAMIYSLIPYRAVDVYVRGDLAEFFAYSFLPWVFWINLKLIKNPKQVLMIPLLGIPLTFLILSHNISVVIYGIFLLAFNGFCILKSGKSNRLVMLRNLSFSVIIALSVSSFYWLPLLIEIRFVQLDRIIADSYSQYFLSLNQLWQTPWGYGGFLQQNPMSLQLGQVVIVVSCLTILLNLIIKTPLKGVIFFFSTAFIISILLETKMTQFLWNIITPLHYLQFPWRLHILNTICGIILIGFFFYLLEYLKIFQQKFGKYFLLIIGFFLILVSLRESYTFFRAKSFMEAKPAAATTTGEEYLPKWVKILPNNYPPDKIELLEGSGKIEGVEWGYYKKSLTVISQKETRVKIAHIYYPGWTAYVNDREVDISYGNKFGQMEINVPKGINKIVFIFQRTWWRWVTDIMSLIGLLGTLFLTIYISAHRKKIELSK